MAKKSNELDVARAILEMQDVYPDDPITRYTVRVFTGLSAAQTSYALGRLEARGALERRGRSLRDTSYIPCVEVLERFTEGVVE